MAVDPGPYHTTAGIIIARFQVPELHVGHRHLIDWVKSKHRHVVVLLGDRRIQPNERHPLDFETRKQMVLAYCSWATVVCLRDTGDNTRWMASVDRCIRDLLPSLSENHVVVTNAVLYGSRDSCVRAYKKAGGAFEIEELPQVSGVSGTQERAAITPLDTVDFRKGVIYAAGRRFPQGHPTIDIAVMRYVKKTPEVLLGKRSPDDEFWRFAGGFFDPEKDFSYEDTACREAREELSIRIRRPQYAGSTVIDDWRYRDSKDRIVTVLFVAKYQGGTPTPSDDLCGGVRWCSLRGLSKLVVPSHQPLVQMLKAFHR